MILAQIAGPVLSGIGVAATVISLAAAGIGWGARKNAELSAAKVDAVRLEIKADMATLELRIASRFGETKEPERLARIEEQIRSIKEAMEMNAATVQLQLSTLQKIRQGCEDCILRDRLIREELQRSRPAPA